MCDLCSFSRTDCREVLRIWWYGTGPDLDLDIENPTWRERGE